MTKENPTNVCAVVVTYNRSEKLRKVLDAIEKQETKPSSIVVVDNASTDDTAAVLAGYHGSIPFEVLSLHENTGGAGGFYLGMRRGYQLQADFLWVMDDDAYPQPDALGNLLSGLTEAEAGLGRSIPFACSVVNYIDGNICEMNNPVPTWDWGRLLAKGIDAVLVSRCSFVSVLIPRWVVTDFGLPRKEYFIWFDDAEYTSRITKEAPGIQVLNSVVVHDMGKNEGVSFERIDDANAWKFAYGIRNEASSALHDGNWARYLLFCANVQRQMQRGRVPLSLRSKMTLQMMKAIGFAPKTDYPLLP